MKRIAAFLLFFMLLVTADLPAQNDSSALVNTTWQPDSSIFKLKAGDTLTLRAELIQKNHSLRFRSANKLDELLNRRECVAEKDPKGGSTKFILKDKYLWLAAGSWKMAGDIIILQLASQSVTLQALTVSATVRVYKVIRVEPRQ